MKSSTVFMRGKDSCVLGKRTAELPKAHVPEETKEIIERKAKVAGMSVAEYLAWVAMIHAHGLATVKKLQDERLQVLATMGEE